MNQLEKTTLGLLTAIKSSCNLQRRDNATCRQCPYVSVTQCQQVLLDALILLKRQTPQCPNKAPERRSGYVWYGCPECKRIVQRAWAACPNCGQYLKWEDESNGQD